MKDRQLQNGNLSFWLSRPDAPIAPDTEVVSSDDAYDVVIVGGGVSGLWTAWSLCAADPALSIAVMEAEHLGFGASGRNGGIVATKSVGNRELFHRHAGREAVLVIERELERSMHQIVNDLGAGNIDARHGGWLQVARSPSEQARIEALLASGRKWGFSEERLRLLSAGQLRALINVDGVTGALYSPENFSVDPVKLLYRLATLLKARGVRIFTRSRTEPVGAKILQVNGHRIGWRRLVIATEAYSVQQRGWERRVLPLISSVVATKPLSTEQWEQIGWRNFEGLAGTAHTFFYAKRTEDGRILIGGRGKAYHYGSRFDDNGKVAESTVDSIMKMAKDLFPALELEPEYAWCGPLAIMRDWSPFVQHDRAADIVRLGGYAGQGMVAAHLAGRIAADLLLGRSTPLTSSAWVRSPPRRWEPEPFRWLGATTLNAAYSLADMTEKRFRMRRTSRIARWANALSGRA